MKIIINIILSILFLPSLSLANSLSSDFKLASTVFEDNAPIPKKYTCDGGDINPPLSLKNIPPRTKSLAVLVSDPDAPEGTWSHWVVYNIPPHTAELKENSNPGTEGLNDFGKYVYGGPCPPDDKVHHYIFSAYALNAVININEGPTISEVESALKEHIIAQTRLVGTYQK